MKFQLPNYPVVAHVDEDIGNDLGELPGKGRVIAYGGNFHAQRRQVMLTGVMTEPADFYMGQSIENVLLDSPVLAGNGTACRFRLVNLRLRVLLLMEKLER